MQFLNYFVMPTSEWSEGLTTRDKWSSLLSNLVTAAVFTFILYVVCTHCYPGVAWFLLLLPIILILILMFIVSTMHM